MVATDTPTLRAMFARSMRRWRSSTISNAVAGAIAWGAAVRARRFVHHAGLALLFGCLIGVCASVFTKPKI